MARRYLFKAEKGNYVRLITTPRLGRFSHKIISTFFSEVKTFDQTKSDSYIALIGKIADREFETYRQEPYSSPDTTLLYLKQRHGGELGKFIENEGKKFDLYSSYGLELRVEMINREAGYLLLGIIDRVATSQELVGVIDYKKGATPSKNKLEENIPTFQLPVYAKLLASQGELVRVDRAAFYSFSNGRYSFIWEVGEADWRDTLVKL